MNTRTIIVAGLSLALCGTALARPTDQQFRTRQLVEDRLHGVLATQLNGSVYREATSAQVTRTRPLPGSKGNVVLAFSGGNSQSGYLEGVRGRAIASTAKTRNGQTMTRLRTFQVLDAAWIRAMTPEARSAYQKRMDQNWKRLTNRWKKR